MCITISAATRARPMHENTTIIRRPPLMRSRAGPSSGATTAKGVMVRSR